MFKIPAWETDVPKTNAVFSKKVKNVKSNHESVEVKPSSSPDQKPLNNKKVKHNVKLTVTTGCTLKNKQKRKGHAISNEMRNDDIFHKESEGFEMDEILVNAKKKKLNDIYKKEDCEELLFGDTIEATSSLTKSQKHKFISGSKNTNIQNNVNKTPRKRKISKDINQEVGNIIMDTKKIKLNDSNIAPSKEEHNNSMEDKRIKKKSTRNTITEKLLTRKNRIEENATDIAEVSEGRQKELDSKRKEKIKQLLEHSHRRPINVKGNQLRERMLGKLQAAQFRYLNEKLYTSSGNEAHQIFNTDPAAFKTYHQGYQQQVKKWPVNPLDVIVKIIQNMPKSFVIADMGCGEAALARRVAQRVHSFDLVAAAPGVVACDMARTPLPRASVDVVVYCLALMGTQLTDYLLEASVKLKKGGQLLIAEVESRFTDVEEFVKGVERLGFRLQRLDRQHAVFVFLQLRKVCDPPASRRKLPLLTLKPCLYKRR